jgi:hypothetical protein
VISRRATIQLVVAGGGIGAAGFAAQRTRVLDDGLRAIGVRPHAEPDPHDVALLAEAAAGQTQLLAVWDALGYGGSPTSDGAALRAVLREQLAAVSDQPSANPSPSTPLPANDTDFAAFAERVEAAAAARADGALSAGSLAVVEVLASMAAGLEQVAVAARRLT